NPVENGRHAHSVEARVLECTQVLRLPHLEGRGAAAGVTVRDASRRTPADARGIAGSLVGQRRRSIHPPGFARSWGLILPARSGSSHGTTRTSDVDSL